MAVLYPLITDDRVTLLNTEELSKRPKLNSMNDMVRRFDNTFSYRIKLYHYIMNMPKHCMYDTGTHTMYDWARRLDLVHALNYHTVRVQGENDHRITLTDARMKVGLLIHGRGVLGAQTKDDLEKALLELNSTWPEVFRNPLLIQPDPLHRHINE